MVEYMVHILLSKLLTCIDNFLIFTMVFAFDNINIDFIEGCFSVLLKTTAYINVADHSGRANMQTEFGQNEYLKVSITQQWSFKSEDTALSCSMVLIIVQDMIQKLWG